ncbi:MAG TPA: PIG-L family deacetylase [Thermoanaerobaculia bacterium]|jgi:LmbE family N-acetylglucosaminyl deacetylase
MTRILAVLLALTVSLSAYARDAAELQLALRKLANIGGALYVAAHPDDENTAMLAWLANDRLYRTAYLSLTRGDGGQNLIGEEKGALLGVIRTQELLAARRIDRAEQMFTRAIDFGFSKSAEETLRIWGHDDVLADVVWAIRKFQPDVIVTRFPPTTEAGHGQHQASAMLAEEAFTAAADPARFPEQLRYVTAWKAKRIYWNRFFRQPVQPDDPQVASLLRIDLGTYNPILGRAYTEIAAQSRSQHKSQGFGAAERRGSLLNYFELRGGEPAQSDLFEGVETRWSRYPGGEKVGTLLQRAADTFDPKNPAASVPQLLQAHAALEQLRAQSHWSDVNRPWLETKRLELLNAIRDCAGIAIDVSAADSAVIAGGELPVSVTVVNRSSYPFRLSMVASLYAQPSKAPGVRLENNKPVKTDLTLRLPQNYNISQPYWLRKQPTHGLFTVTEQTLIGTPENAPSIPINVTLDDTEMNTLVFTVPAVFRQVDPVKGEQVREVSVVPPVTANLGSGVYLFPDAKPRPVTVVLRSFGVTDADVRLVLPPGWRSDPEKVTLRFSGKGDEMRVPFSVTPAAGETSAQLNVELGGRTTSALTEIEYDHIPAQRLFNDIGARVVRADVKRIGNRIGYIMGSGDEIPNVLRQIGYEVTVLTDADLDRGDFSMFDAVVTGIRAYNTRKRLKEAHEKLLQYVQAGGTMVVQYNTANGLDDLVVQAPGPYPFKISRDRVTVEDAPVKLLDRDHPLLNTPNRISEVDFNGWVQERGLYFPNEWDPRYFTLLSTADPGETEKAGGQLVARYGKGVYVYTAYAWWRQLPAGVPGAIRAFVNLVSAK